MSRWEFLDYFLLKTSLKWQSGKVSDKQTDKHLKFEDYIFIFYKSICSFLFYDFIIKVLSMICLIGLTICKTSLFAAFFSQPILNSNTNVVKM